MSNPIVVEEVYEASPDQVWQAITDKDSMKEWYFNIQDFILKENATFNFYAPDDERKYHHQCVIKKIVPERKFQHTWTYPSHSKGESVITWEISPEGNGSRVRLTHSGVESFSDAGNDFTRENFEAGWKEIVGKSLKDFISLLVANKNYLK